MVFHGGLFGVLGGLFGVLGGWFHVNVVTAVDLPAAAGARGCSLPGCTTAAPRRDPPPDLRLPSRLPDSRQPARPDLVPSWSQERGFLPLWPLPGRRWLLLTFSVGKHSRPGNWGCRQRLCSPVRRCLPPLSAPQRGRGHPKPLPRCHRRPGCTRVRRRSSPHRSYRLPALVPHSRFPGALLQPHSPIRHRIHFLQRLRQTHAAVPGFDRYRRGAHCGSLPLHGEGQAPPLARWCCREYPQGEQSLCRPPLLLALAQHSRAQDCHRYCPFHGEFGFWRPALHRAAPWSPPAVPLQSHPVLNSPVGETPAETPLPVQPPPASCRLRRYPCPVLPATRRCRRHSCVQQKSQPLEFFPPFGVNTRG